MTTREWLVEVRKDWAEQANHALGEAHRTAILDHVKWEQDRAARERDSTRWEYIDHRTLAAQCGAAHRKVRKSSAHRLRKVKEPMRWAVLACFLWQSYGVAPLTTSW